VRLSYSDTNNDGVITASSDPSTNEIIEESNYYPFGLQHKGYNNVINGTENNYFNFNGKELDESLGLNVIEMDWRQYDPALGRFNVVDPLAEERNWLSPYNFGQNNPIVRVDPTGLLDDYGLDQDGNIELIKPTGDDTDTLYSVTRGEDGELVKDDNGEVVRNDTNGDGAVADGDSVTVEKGILNNKKTNTVEASNGKEYTFDQFNITGDSQAQNLFEFVGANSNVEWSLTGVGSKNGSQGSNILTTSHIENSEIGGGYLFAYGYSIRFSNHSHPYSNTASRADRSFAKSINEKFPNARTRILHKGSYTLYDEKGSIKPIQIKPMPIVPFKN
jgi:RHS repeat-associated protein